MFRWFGLAAAAQIGATSQDVARISEDYVKPVSVSTFKGPRINPIIVLR